MSLAAFIIWSVIGFGLCVLGIVTFFIKKPASFMAGISVKKVDDVKGYNRATGILYLVYGAVFILLGLPLIWNENMALILLSIVCVVFETIICVAIYSVRIANKYSLDLE